MKKYRGGNDDDNMSTFVALRQKLLGRYRLPEIKRKQVKKCPNFSNFQKLKTKSYSVVCIWIKTFKQRGRIQSLVFLVFPISHCGIVFYFDEYVMVVYLSSIKTVIPL